MNNIKFYKQTNSTQQKIELTLSPVIHDAVMTPMKQFFLINILQGERKEFPDGRTFYSFYLPNEFAEKLKEMFLQAYSKASGYSNPN